MSKQLDMFKTNLEEFASKHKQEIRKNPEFRVQFQDMCATIGVDPLACKESPAGVQCPLGSLRDRSFPSPCQHCWDVLQKGQRPHREAGAVPSGQCPASLPEGFPVVVLSDVFFFS